MNGAPEFIDNRDGNTMAEALVRVLGGSLGGMAEEAAARPADLAVAAAFFSPKGLSDLSPHLEGLDRVRLMFGVEAPRDVEVRRPELGEPPERFEARLVREGLRQSEAAARAARDRFPFTREGVAALRRLVAHLRAEHVEVRRYERAFLHAKAYVFASPDGVFGGRAGVIAGSSNLTGGGLARNLELNLGRYDDPVVRQARAWFDDLWAEAEPVDLAGLYEEIFAPYTPWEIFLRILFRLYSDEVGELAKEDKGLPLTSFQTHGVARALRLIRDCGGAIVADEVGLGKTFIAAEVVRVYHANRQRALLICPAQLRDTTWKKFLARHRLEISVECLSFEELANDAQLRDPRRAGPAATHLERPLHEYQLVVVDEAHNYRNPDAPTRAAVLRRLLFGQRRDLLLLTATPVNNSLWDLFHLIRFFVRQDAFLAERGVLSLYERFQQAMRTDPSDLSPDLLYPIIDSTCVKRTREFVKKHYTGDTIIGPDGRRQAIIFPRPQPITVRYALDDPLPALFDDVETALDPNGHAGALSFSRYGVEAFRKGAHDAEEDARLAATVGLIRSALLKRFESSPYAFRRTLETLIAGHEVFLEALDKGRVVTTRFLREIGADEETTLDELLATSPEAEPADLFDAPRLRRAVESDLAILRRLAAGVGQIAPEKDSKLIALVHELENIASQAAEEGLDPIDEIQKRKAILFSFFADTVKYVRDFLVAEADRNPNLRAYRGRIAAVTGGDDLEEFSRQDALYGFAPISTEAPPRRDADLYDSCQHRRARRGRQPPAVSPRHQSRRAVEPDAAGATARTHRPHRQHASARLSADDLSRRAARSASQSGAAHPRQDRDGSGLDRRRETCRGGGARRAGLHRDARRNRPAAAGRPDALRARRHRRGGANRRGVPANLAQSPCREPRADNQSALEGRLRHGQGGGESGVLFCAAVGPRTYLRFVRTDADWQPLRLPAEPETGNPGGPAIESDTPRVVPKSLEEDVIFDLWEVAQQDIWRAWTLETDPANLQPKVRPLNRRVADFIRANQPPETDAARINAALDVVESPWPRREEAMLREWFDDARAGAAKAASLIDRILETGLEPFRGPEPLPPIRFDEIKLLCWLALSPEIRDGIEGGAA
jgi:hypothetical protein